MLLKLILKVLLFVYKINFNRSINMNKNSVKEVCIQADLYKKTNYQLQTCSTCEYDKEICI